ncbi:preprotein translocase subunit SecY [Patescibacteria group bacterium]|nr:preprotein translocase subunit SecY [Patescibacteria group bacterium]MBU4162448.1 preprotein translocase subunit SecY [Patescibacteria group bacterium]
MNFSKIIQIFKIKDLRKKILFVLAIFLLFRLMANIPVPGIDAQNLQGFFDRFQMFGLLNIFTGGTLAKLSIVMLGIGPYITATIILQLLTMIFPALEKIYKEEGAAGRQRFNQYGRILTIPLAIMQGYAMLNLLQRTPTAGGEPAIGALSPIMMISALITVTAGAMFLVWLGEMITEKGIGNGVSLLIFAGIVSSIPGNIYQFAFSWDPAQLPGYLLFFGAAFLIIIGVVLVTEARRNIPVSYAKRVRGNKIYGGSSTYLPLNVNPAGVIPIIFALSILLFPQMIGSFFANAGGVVGSIARSVANFQNHEIAWGTTYFILVFAFTYFYTMVTFDPKAISNNLKKMGGFVPGIRPGESTASFLTYILHRVLFIGAMFLSVIAIMPYLIKGITGVTSFSFLVGGTSLLIVVAVVLDTVKQINAQLQMREYETL